MTIISYAQNFEDVMLWRALGHISSGFYIDVGAHDPELGSVTKAFYDNGWSGINIEPILEPLEKLKSARPRDLNLQFCAGSYNGAVEIYDVAPSGLATIKPRIAEEYKAQGYPVTVSRVENRTLAAICDEHIAGDIHFLKIDAEGAEKEVLLGANFNLYRPWIIVVEATYPNSPKQNHTKWEDIILNNGYEFVYFDGLNRFYIANEKKQLLSHFEVPPNVFDGFALSSSCFFARNVEAKSLALEVQIQEKISKNEQLEDYVRCLQEKLNDSESKMNRAEVELEDLKAQMQEAISQNKQLEGHSQLLQEELQEILSSTSWRITLPLRKIKEFILRLFNHGSQLLYMVVYPTKRLVRWSVVRVVTFALSYPAVKSKAVVWVRRYPKLNNLLRRVAESEGLIPLAVTLSTSVVSHSNSDIFSKRAKEIHIDIEMAIAEQHCEGD